MAGIDARAFVLPGPGTGTDPAEAVEGLILKQEEVKVTAGFVCDLEVYDRAKFQAAGHYVLSTVKGDRVYILNLRYKGSQVLRTQGNTMSEVVEAMDKAISQTLFGLWTADHQRTQLWTEICRLGDERNRLVEFVNYYYGPEFLTFLGQGLGVYDLTLHYLRKERGRFWVRVLNLFRGRKRGAAAAGAPNPTGDPTNSNRQ